MKVVVLQSNYLPWRGYFDLVNDADVFCFYDDVKYTKNDWRNRNLIYSKNGLQWLTIPVASNSVKYKIDQVTLTDFSWQEKHFKTIKLAYGKAPFSYQLNSFLDEIYLQTKWSSLSELNQFVIRKISDILAIDTDFISSSDYNLNGQKGRRLLNLLQQIGAKTYISGPSAKTYLDPLVPLFEKAGIQVKYKVYPAYPEYRQLKKPFIGSVSILDMIANLPLQNISSYIWNNVNRI